MNRMILLWKLVFVSGVLVLGSVVEKETCIDSYIGEIECKVYMESAAECHLTRNDTERMTMTPLPNVTDISIDRYFNNKGRLKDTTGVMISWKSPDAMTLNETEGYVLRLRYMKNGTEESYLCRYFKVQSIHSVVRWSLPERATFRHFVPSIPMHDVKVTVELLTLPHSLPAYPAASKTFITYGSMYDNYPWNVTETTSTPFSLSVSFRSRDDSIDILYNHTSYELLLLTPRDGMALYLNGSLIVQRYLNKSTTEEYLGLTWTNLKPGKYKFEISPRIWDLTHCAACGPNSRIWRCSRCGLQSDRNNIYRSEITVSGFHYTRPPQLYVAENNDITITIDVAPDYLHIDRYEVIVRQANSLSNSSLQRMMYADAGKEWTTTHVKFNYLDVYDQFEVGDEVIAQVVPSFVSSLCPTSGHCNLAGDCQPCRPSLSVAKAIRNLKSVTFNTKVTAGADVTISVGSSSSNEGDKSVTLKITWIALSVSIATILLLTICLTHVMRRRHRRNAAVVDEMSSISTRSLEISAGSEETPSIYRLLNRQDVESRSEMLIFKTPVLRVCLAFSSSLRTKASYARLSDTLSNIFRKYFHCEVISYEQLDCRNPQLNLCDCVLVLSSAELCNAFRYKRSQLEGRSQHPPATMTRMMIPHYRVLELLVANKKPTRILLTFDGIAENYNLQSETGVSDSHSMSSYHLPTQLYNLIKAMWSSCKDAQELKFLSESWGFYLQDSVLPRRLVADVNYLADELVRHPFSSFEDSAFESQSTYTLTTLDQNQTAGDILLKNERELERDAVAEFLDSRFDFTRVAPTLVDRAPGRPADNREMYNNHRYPRVIHT